MAKRGARARGRSMSRRKNTAVNRGNKPPGKSMATPKRGRKSKPPLSSEWGHFKKMADARSMRRSEQLRLPLCDPTNETLRAYSIPKAFESQQQSNGHLSAQERILGLLKRYIGKNVVSLASGTGWLDRKLVLLKETYLHDGGELRLLGLDLTPDNVLSANQEMEALVKKNHILNRAYTEGRFRFEYINARLGKGKTILDSEGNDIVVPSFSDIDLRSTVLESPTADTFLIFMALVLWVHEREMTIQAIADRSHKASGEQSPTYLINGEEYPTHITPNKFLSSDFEKAVQKNREDEVSTDVLWGKLFPIAGFRQIPGARSVINFSDSTEDHALQYTALRYEGGSNPFGFRKIQ